MPFAGKYRIIDFALSNCINSGIFDVAVLTQYRPHSLHDHIGIGRPWDLDRQLSFTPYMAAALLEALQRALRLYGQHDRWPALVARAMTYDSRWSASAHAYSDLYQRVFRASLT